MEWDVVNYIPRSKVSQTVLMTHRQPTLLQSTEDGLRNVKQVSQIFLMPPKGKGVQQLAQHFPHHGLGHLATNTRHRIFFTTYKEDGVLDQAKYPRSIPGPFIMGVLRELSPLLIGREVQAVGLLLELGRHGSYNIRIYWCRGNRLHTA